MEGLTRYEQGPVTIRLTYCSVVMDFVDRMICKEADGRRRWDLFVCEGWYWFDAAVVMEFVLVEKMKMNVM